MSRNFLGLQDIEDKVEILGTTVYETEVNSNEQIQMNSNSKTDDQPLTIQRFREDNVDESSPRQRFIVSREDRLDDLKKDILGCYKNPQINLKAKPRVKFEGEEGVGSGPIREFLLCAMKIVEEGINKEGKPLVFFEGQEDHKVPVHNHVLRCTGAFRSIGRIIGHSILHQGPFIYGLSPAVVQYWRLTVDGNDDDTSLESLALGLEDIPDTDLRDYITQVILNLSFNH